MSKLRRRDFLEGSLFPAALTIAAGRVRSTFSAEPGDSAIDAPPIIDTNVSLGNWPFRRFKYGRTADLVTKLRKHRVTEAWTGSFEAIFHKNLDAVNGRLAEECRTAGDGLLVPFGTVNPAWPDWEEDLRRCHEVHGMRGIRLFPEYHPFTFDHPEFARLLAAAAKRALLVQIAFDPEDERVHHAVLVPQKADAAQLVAVLAKSPPVNVELLNWRQVAKGKSLKTLADETNVAFDIADLEGAGAVGRLTDGNHWSMQGHVSADRLLFGSNTPYQPLESALFRLFESPLSRAKSMAVMYENARRFSAGVQTWTTQPPAFAPAKYDEPRRFDLDPHAYGLPNRDDLAALRIWDLHYHGFNAADGIRQNTEMRYYVERMGIERVVSLDISGTRTDPFASSGMEDEQRKMLSDPTSNMLGIVRIDPSDPARSCEKMEEWIRRGPCIGIKYAGFNRDGLKCSHPNNVPIIKLAAELKAVIYIHSWLTVGGEPRRLAGGIQAGESTPMDVALLAERFPDVPLICGHSGGDWELGVRAIRPYRNVYLEFSGSDPHSGQVDYAVKELGAERIVWGGHGPSRSYSTELSKVFDADLTDDQRRLILGGNLRRIAGPILKAKGREDAE